MNLVASCKEKLASFRLKELKEVLTQLGVSKQGKKQELVDRILALLSDEQASRMWTKKSTLGREEVAKLIDDISRKMQGYGANDLACEGQGTSDSSNLKIKGEIDDPIKSDVKVRCPCGSSLQTDSMIKCEDSTCCVSQHIGCVIIPDKPTEGSPPISDLFYCELCRLNRADPFWVTVKHPLYPVKLTTATIPADGSNPVQSVERTFQITRDDKELLALQEFDIQAWCMLLNDKVRFRMQWLQYAELQVNGSSVRAVNRPGSQLLGANGREDGPIITAWTKEGINKIFLTGCDARIFCFGVRIVKRRTAQQVLSLIPKEPDGEHFEDALARVCRCIGGINGEPNADSDSDIEVVADFFSVNLRCPMSGSRMKVAGRFKPCAHMGCFDLKVFIELNQRSKKWQCPICLKNYSLENIIIDPYFNRITSQMTHCGEDVTEVEVKSDGAWRVKHKTERDKRELGNLAEWHLPNGTLCPTTSEGKQKVQTGEGKQKMQTPTRVKQEAISESHSGLKLGIRRNENGVWQVNRPEDMNTASCSDDRLRERLRYLGQKVIQMSSSPSGSGRDGEDLSVNQENGGTIGLANNGIELDSLSLNADSSCGVSNRNQSAPPGNSEVIILSDSDEENDILISSGPAYNGNQTDCGLNFSVPPSGVSDLYREDPTLGNGEPSCFGNDDDFGMSLWQIPDGTQGGSGFQLFSSDADVSDALADLQNGSLSCGPSNGYMGSEPAQGSMGHSNAALHDGFIDYPLGFGGDDPSLQLFLQTGPSDASAPSELRNQAGPSNGLQTDDWISLRLGDGAAGSCEGSSTANRLGTSQHLPLNGLSSGQLMPSNGLATSHHMPSNGLRTGHRMPSNGLDTSQHMLSNGLGTSQHMPSNGLGTSQHMPSNGLGTCQHIPSNGLSTSQHMSSNGLGTSQHMPSNGLSTSQHMASGEASSHLGTNDGRPQKASRQRSQTDSPFSFPRQKRSVRPRLYLSIDSSSE